MLAVFKNRILWILVLSCAKVLVSGQERRSCHQSKRALMEPVAQPHHRAHRGEHLCVGQLNTFPQFSETGMGVHRAGPVFPWKNIQMVEEQNLV